MMAALTRKNFLPLFAALALLLSIGAGQAYASGAADNKTVLILGSTVIGGTGSLEALQAQAAGLTVEVASNSEWLSKTTDEFRSYRAIVLGDPICSTSPSTLGAALQNRSTWGPAIQGNVVVVGTDPSFHSKDTITRTGINYAAAGTSTGAYITLSCYYFNAPAGTSVPVLDVFGTFTVVGQGGCPADSHIVAQHPALSGLTDADLSNWGCSTHEGFVSWPAKFQVLAISRDVPSSFVAADGSSGAPYILARPGSGFYVAIDAGHGAILNTNGVFNYQRPSIPPYGIIEDQITLDIAQRVQALLISDGIRVLMIRSGDPAPYAPVGCGVPCTSDTRARAKKADKENVDLFVSIHTNALGPTAHGTETYYTSSTGYATKSLAIATGLFNEQVGLGLRPRSVQDNVVSNVLLTQRPAALSEVAFHTNTQLASDQTQESDLDAFKLSQQSFRISVAQAIAKAIKDYHATHP